MVPETLVKRTSKPNKKITLASRLLPGYTVFLYNVFGVNMVTKMAPLQTELWPNHNNKGPVQEPQSPEGEGGLLAGAQREHLQPRDDSRPGRH